MNGVEGIKVIDSSSTQSLPAGFNFKNGQFTLVAGSRRKMVTVGVSVVQLVPTMRIFSIKILEGRLMVSNYALKNILSYESYETISYD